MSNPSNFKSRKVLVAVTLIIVSIMYVVWQHLGSDDQSETMPIVSNASTTIPTQNNSITITPTPVAQSSQPQKSSGAYVDGTYTGTPANAYYGTVQVQAVVKSGVLADVTFLQYPSDRNTSRMISDKAMPILTQEALQIQSAQVDGVSGATQISDAFKQSLASALSQAKN
jgi:uncharacterized protein with FMN-binding domain